VGGKGGWDGRGGKEKEGRVREERRGRGGSISYRSSIETLALNCLVFEKITFLYFGNRQTNRWTGPMHETALAVASGVLITPTSLSHYLQGGSKKRGQRVSFQIF